MKFNYIELYKIIHAGTRPYKIKDNKYMKMQLIEMEKKIVT